MTRDTGVASQLGSRVTFGKFRRWRSLPYPGRILVEVGQKVDPDTVVARLEYIPGPLRKFNAAREAGVEPSHLEEFALVVPGQEVSKGDLVALAGDFFSLRPAYAPVSGTVALVSKHLGSIYIREPISLGKDEETEIDVAKALDIPAFRLNDFLKVGQGKVAFQGQVVASRMVGLEVKSAVSPMYGRVKEVRLDKGTITMVPLFRSTDLIAHLSGVVTKIRDTHAVEIETQGTLVTGAFGLGGEGHGPLEVLEGDLTEVDRDHDSLPFDCRGKVIACRGQVGIEAIRNLVDRGAKGLIAGSISLNVLREYVGGTFNPALTGEEDVPFPIVVTEGFLPAQMDQEIFAALKQNRGEIASVTGVTHIRAGVIRPEISLASSSAQGDRAAKGVHL